MPQNRIGICRLVLATFVFGAPAATVFALDVNDRFRLDFYLNAGVATGEWARFDPPRLGTRPLVAEASLGLPEDGFEADHWYLAGRGTYRLGRSSEVVLQLSHRRFGDSTLTDAEDAVELDWLYFEKVFGESTSVRLGRTPVTFGLLNELRDEGAELPFFHVPFAFYDEGGFVTETVDGARFRHRFGRDDGWGLTFEAYGGTWELLEMSGSVNRLAGTVDGIATRVETVDVDEGYGGALWFHTPGGVRFGGGAQRLTTEGGIASHLPGEETDWEHDFLSFEVDQPRYLLRAEGRQARFPSNFLNAAIGLPTAGEPGAGFLTEIETEAWYVTVGARFPGGWAVYAKMERGGELFQCFGILDLRCDRLLGDRGPFLTKQHGERTWDDSALAVTYELRKNLLLRAEYHQTEGVALRRDITRFGFVLTREFPVEDGYFAMISVAWRL